MDLKEYMNFKMDSYFTFLNIEMEAQEKLMDSAIKMFVILQKQN